MILLFGFCARAITYRAPLLDHHAWRQADTAAISRNFATESLNPLYPQIDWRGARPVGYVETGLEAFALLAAVIARIGGGFTPEIGRLLATACFVVSGLLLEAFARRRDGERIGLVTAFVYAFGFPLALFMDRSFMNEPLLITLSIACLFVTQRYLERGERSRLVLLVVLTACLGAIKLPFLIVWAPIAGLFAERRGWRAVSHPALLIVFAVDLVVAAAWYTHAHRLGADTGFTFGMTDKLFDPAIVFSIDFPFQIGRRLFKDVFGFTLVFFVVGLADIWRARRLCELGAVASYVVYLLILARGNYIHDYYQLPIVVIAPVIAALGVDRAGAWLASRIGSLGTAALPLILGAILISTLLRSVSAHSWYEIDPDLAQVCAQSQTFLKPDDRLLFIANSDPKLLFCMDRRGWLLSEPQSEESQMNEALSAGATVAIVMKTPAMPAGTAWADANGTTVFENPSLVAYRLSR